MRHARTCLFAIALLMALGSGASAQEPGGMPFAWWGTYRLYGSLFQSEGFRYDYLDQRLDLNVALPLVDPRLGTVTVSAGLYATLARQGTGSDLAKDSTGGLGTWGLDVDLFPYRRFPTHLYFRRDQTQYPFQGRGGRLVFTQAGLNTQYRGGYFDQLRLDFTHSGTRISGASSSVDLLAMDVNKNLRLTSLWGDLSLFRDTASGQAGQTGGSLGFYSHTQVNEGAGDWYNRANVARSQFGDSAFQSGYFQTALNLPLSKETRIYALASAGTLRFGETDTESYAASAGWQWAHLRELLRLGFSSSQSDSRGGSVRARIRQDQIYTAWTHALSARWFTTVDATIGRVTDPSEGANSSYGVHAGIGWGGATLPGLIEKMAFFVQDQAFSRRLYAEFPPGYAPPEVQLALLRHQESRVGAASAGLDAYHMTQEVDGRRAAQDLFRFSGRFSVSNRFSLWADARDSRERGGTSGDLDRRDVILTADMSFTAYSRLYVALSENRTRRIFGAIPPVGPPVTGQRGIAAEYDYTRLRWAPLRVSAERYTYFDGQTFTRARLVVPLRYGLLASSLNYEYVSFNGQISHRITFDLSRAFYGWR